MTPGAIRPATRDDLPRVVEVEAEAGRLFLSVGMPEVAGDVPRASDLHEPLHQGRIWVSQVGPCVAGYIVAEVLDGNGHVAQVSVAPPYAGRGLGRGLIEHVEAWGRAAGRPATTLTTFRDVPWNGPYYARLGYRELLTARIGPELARAMAHEATLPGIDPALRIAMVRPDRGSAGRRRVT